MVAIRRPLQRSPGRSTRAQRHREHVEPTSTGPRCNPLILRDLPEERPSTHHLSSHTRTYSAIKMSGTCREMRGLALLLICESRGLLTEFQVGSEEFLVTAASETKRINKGKQRAIQAREAMFPTVPSDLLWHRLTHDGYMSVPRTLPYVMNIIDSFCKGQPASRTYLGLWLRAYDEAVVIIENPMSLAVEAGFSGERAITSWRQRMQTLVELGFIQAREGGSGPYHYVLLLNPHKVVWDLKSSISERAFMQLRDRALEVGAVDINPPVHQTELALTPPGKASRKAGRTKRGAT